MILYQVHEYWEEDEAGIDTWYRNKKEALAHYSRVLRDYRREWREYERESVEELRDTFALVKAEEPSSLLSLRVYRAELRPDKTGIVEALNDRFYGSELIRETDFDATIGIPGRVYKRLTEVTERL